MKISIVTATKNSKETVADTIDSVLSQNYKNFEHIVVDNDSNDGTLDEFYDKSFIYENRLFINTGKDKGIYDAFNKGIKLSTGDIIGILNSDDVFSDEFVLSHIVKAFADDEDLMCVYGDLIFVKRNSPSIIKRIWKGSQYYCGIFSTGWQPAHPTFYVRRSCYEKFGLYDLNFGNAADFELMLRLLEVNKCKSLYLPITMVNMRLGGVSTCSIKNIIKGNFNIYKAFKHHNIKISSFYYFKRLFPKAWNMFILLFKNKSNEKCISIY